jgi:hypothetical protein
VRRCPDPSECKQRQSAAPLDTLARITSRSERSSHGRRGWLAVAARHASRGHRGAGVSSTITCGRRARTSAAAWRRQTQVSVARMAPGVPRSGSATYRHFGKPLHPMNGPNLPVRLTSGLPHSGQVWPVGVAGDRLDTLAAGVGAFFPPAPLRRAPLLPFRRHRFCVGDASSPPSFGTAALVRRIFGWPATAA